MRFGLACFILIFLGVEGFQWVTHLSWLSNFELSLPMTVLSGVGLAIASRPRQPLANQPSPPSSLSPEAPPPQRNAPIQPVAQLQSPAPSVSFKIKKPFSA